MVANRPQPLTNRRVRRRRGTRLGISLPQRRHLTSDVEKQEPRHKVRSEQELIDVIDATRKKVDATTKEISDFLEQMKKRKQTSLERL
jgi:hypothetical protein